MNNTLNGAMISNAIRALSIPFGYSILKTHNMLPLNPKKVLWLIAYNLLLYN